MGEKRRNDLVGNVPEMFAKKMKSHAASSIRNRPPEPGLTGSVPAHHSFWRLQEDLQVEPGRTVSRVAQVEPHHVVKFYSAAAIYLPESSDSWLRLEQTATMPGSIGFHFIGHWWTRSD